MHKIERQIAPFWRGLEDYQSDWTEHQLIAAGRGLPIPAAEEVPTQDNSRPHSSDSPNKSGANLPNLMPPLASRTQSASYDTSIGPYTSRPGFNASSHLNALAASTSLLRPRAKTLALKSSSRESPTLDTTPREIQLPRDTKVNGQAIEAFLYKDSVECTICLIWYPPYLNKTRCCDQNICSECFVQIKRPEPHPPEHHDPSQPAPAPDANPESAEASELLVSKPAACPYCTESDFGVTYEPPPFRRGLVYAKPSRELANFSSAMSSTLSINSPSATSPGLGLSEDRRRATSLPADDPRVITTDRIRPDWLAKLEQANAQRRKRFAAASALHAAAFVLPGTNESRPISFRFTNRNRSSDNAEASGSATPSNRDNSSRTAEQSSHTRRGEPPDSESVRAYRENLEDLMVAEAIRLSLAVEDERKKKADRAAAREAEKAEKEAAKEAAKQAKKQAKEDKKKEKLERKSIYGASGSSASSSALNLASMLTGRKRGNSNASHLATEVTPEEVEEPAIGKGKGVDRAPMNQGTFMDSGLLGTQNSDPSTSSSLLETPQSFPSPTAPDRPSHLRQMSTASSDSSSLIESGNATNAHGSYSSIASPGATGSNHDGHEDDDAGTEPLFNFNTLKARVEDDEDNEKRLNADHVENVHEASTSGSQDENTPDVMDQSVVTLRASVTLTELQDLNITHPVPTQKPATSIDTSVITPQLTVTPDTPAAMNSAEEDGKQLGSNFEQKSHAEITQ